VAQPWEKDAKQGKELCKAGTQLPWVTGAFPSPRVRKALESKFTQAMLFNTPYFSLRDKVYWQVFFKAHKLNLPE